MENEFIPYEEALALKELGFDEPCFCAYKEGYKVGKITKAINSTHDYFNGYCYNSDRLSNGRVIPNQERDLTNISAPLYQQAFRFLLPLIEHKTINNYVFRVILIKKNGNYLLQRKYYTYGNSFENFSDGSNEDCVKKLIEIVKNNK